MGFETWTTSEFVDYIRVESGHQYEVKPSDLSESEIDELKQLVNDVEDMNWR